VTGSTDVAFTGRANNEHRPTGSEHRRSELRAAARRRFDVIVIGGGINGAGIARDAALRGLSVLLLERNDHGFGTTWRSTKLIHGGLRYLEHREFRLVFEGLHERATLLRTAPHLVRPLEFLVPVFRGGRYGPRTIRAGLVLYDLLSAGKRLPSHRSHSREGVAALEPAINARAIRGGFTYFDAQVPFPERLCLENVLDAVRNGASSFNHIEVNGLLATRGQVQGVRARDAETGAELEFLGRTVVNAAGPWVDLVLRRAGRTSRQLGGTKGSHIVVDFGGAGPSRAIYAEAGADGRPFFIIPWNGLHLVGTTDIRFTGDPATVLPDDAEVEYLTREVKRVLPGAPLSPEAVMYAFAGVRPLPRTPDGREGAITRRHFVHHHDQEGLSGLLSVVGGKLTSYRALAQEALDLIASKVPTRAADCSTDSRPLVPGLPPTGTDPLARHLTAILGANADRVLALARLDPELGAPLCAHGPDVIAQAVHAVRSEGARTVADVLLRRTPAGWNRCRGLDAAPSVARVLAAELGWDKCAEDAAVSAYRAEVDATLVPLGGAIDMGFESRLKAGG
jgi:glycerol-3-phosphate dehydrogenase